MTAAYKVPLKIEQGATFKKQAVWKMGKPLLPVDLTGCTALAHVRANIKAAQPLLVLSTENNRIELGDLLGTVTLILTAAETAAIEWTNAVYDLEITFADGTVRRLMYGSVSVSPEVTRG